jgi:hypothetical protein
MGPKEPALLLGEKNLGWRSEATIRTNAAGLPGVLKPRGRVKLSRESMLGHEAHFDHERARPTGEALRISNRQGVPLSRRFTELTPRLAHGQDEVATRQRTRPKLACSRAVRADAR